MSAAPDPSRRRALITGAGQGVGAAIADRLGSARVTVIVNDVVADRAHCEVERLRSVGVDAEAAVFDVTDYEAVIEAVERLGRVDILVNNAGNAGADQWPGMVAFHESEPASWTSYFAVNLFGVMHCTRAVLPAMVRSGWGRVVTILSDAARVGEPKLAAYAGAKAGAAGVMRSVANDVARYGVTVNCVALGTMRTPLTESYWASLDDDAMAKRMAAYPIRRPGLPDDVAPLVQFLVSEESSYITGQTIPVNGGYSMAL